MQHKTQISHLLIIGVCLTLTTAVEPDSPSAKNKLKDDPEATNATAKLSDPKADSNATLDDLSQGNSTETNGTTEAEMTSTEAMTTEAMTTEEPVKIIPLLSLEQLENITGSWSCNSPIYCRGPLLDAVQRNGIFHDSKTFVDLPMKDDPDVIVEAFDDIMKYQGAISKRELKAFIKKHFMSPGDDLEIWHLNDWTEDPEFLDNIADPALRTWAEAIHETWKSLARKVKEPTIPSNSTRHSLITVPNGFILPATTSRELRYWDTYWIVKGLLVSGMTNTTRDVIENLLYMVKEYKMVPTGGRIYFSNRSQPPMLAQMVHAYYEATNDSAFVEENFALLEQEYNFWVSDRSITVSKDGKDYAMAFYKSNLVHPRAEGYQSDLETSRGMTSEQAANHFSNLASAVESGWDFSTRWFEWKGDDEYTLNGIKTNNIVPVDLNVFLYLTEEALSKLAEITAKSDKVSRYADLAAVRKAAIDDVFWHEEDGIWYDYDLAANTSTRRRFFISNLTPLLTLPTADRVETVIHYLMKEDVLKYPGGVPTSTLASGQQWDFPNAWPPYMEMVISGLAQCESIDAQEMATNLSRAWIGTTYAAWAKSGHMYDKYMVRKLGGVGIGGDHKAQVGFGWTNGVILSLLEQYGNSNDTHAPDGVKVTYNKSNAESQWGGHNAETKVSFVFIPVILLVLGVLFFICFMKRRITHRAKRPSSAQTYESTPFQKFEN